MDKRILPLLIFIYTFFITFVTVMITKVTIIDKKIYINQTQKYPITNIFVDSKNIFYNFNISCNDVKPTVYNYKNNFNNFKYELSFYSTKHTCYFNYIYISYIHSFGSMLFDDHNETLIFYNEYEINNKTYKIAKNIDLNFKQYINFKLFCHSYDKNSKINFISSPAIDVNFGKIDGFGDCELISFNFTYVNNDEYFTILKNYKFYSIFLLNLN